MKRFALLVVCILQARAAIAQSCPPTCAFTTRTFPLTINVAWIANPVEDEIFNYEVYLDDALVNSTIGLSLDVPVTATGPHTIGIRSVNATGKSPATTMSFTVTASATIPAPRAPGGVMLSVAAVISSTETNSKTSVTYNGHLWTIERSGGVSRTLRDGVWMASGDATEYLVMPTGLYCLGSDGIWYKWQDAAGSWLLFGQRPNS